MRYSIGALARNALNGHRHWPRAWRDAEPRDRYDVIIVGGGGHGLATAYYLAKRHGLRRVAVLERGWIGGGNTGRNTTIVRSNYFLRVNSNFYEHSLKLWEGLTAELNFNLMFSQRGVVNLCHSQAELEGFVRRYNSNRLNGVDGEVLTLADLRRLLPDLDLSPDARFPVVGGVIQARGGVARHDAVAWGYARAADALGVDIVQNCEVTGFDLGDDGMRGVITTRGRVAADKVAIAVAGNSSEVARLAGLRLPIESHLLQAMVTEPVKPLLDHVVSSGAYHVYISQTDKGELVIGGALDGYNSYSQRGRFSRIEQLAASAVDLFPRIRRLRLMRKWSGTVDMTMDGSPIIGKTPVDGLYLNGGWCYGGFKATPASGWCFAHTIAEDEPHGLNAAYSLDRFSSGRLINERGAGNRPGAH
ncbi:sarcosine oxidase subunit beta family protein [Pelagibius sp. CAU 1746]|uniref:sarcosine oxidase subunit beta family protein n=1 Tax=Pelagibius sp. CAU 1746 TaxID=3140370 RepID=UPI00325B49CF